MKATGNFEQVKNVDPLVVLNEHTRHHIDQWVASFPPDRKRSALIQALFAAQEQNHGFLTDELITAVAKYLDLPAVWAYEVATLLFDVRDQAGRPQQRGDLHQHLVLAQRRRGPREACEKKLGIKLGESTPDGRVYLKREEECIAACASAPMMIVNGHYHERLTAQKVDEILDGLK